MAQGPSGVVDSYCQAIATGGYVNQTVILEPVDGEGLMVIISKSDADLLDQAVAIEAEAAK